MAGQIGGPRKSGAIPVSTPSHNCFSAIVRERISPELRAEWLKQTRPCRRRRTANGLHDDDADDDDDDDDGREMRLRLIAAAASAAAAGRRNFASAMSHRWTSLGCMVAACDRLMNRPDESISSGRHPTEPARTNACSFGGPVLKESPSDGFDLCCSQMQTCCAFSSSFKPRVRLRIVQLVNTLDAGSRVAGQPFRRPVASDRLQACHSKPRRTQTTTMGEWARPFSLASSLI